MAFPTIANQTSGLVTANSNAWTLTYPSGIASGDLIVAVAGTDGAVTGSSTGFNDWDNTDATATCWVGARIADGTETGNFTLSLSGNEQGCWLVMRITGWFGSGLPASTPLGQGGSAHGDGFSIISDEGSGTAPNPLALDPTNWDIEDTLWLAIGASDHGNTTYTGKDAGFTYVTGSPQESGGANGAALAVSYLASFVASMDPGAYTTDAAEGWVTMTIGVRPAAAAERYAGFMGPTVPPEAVRRAASWFRRHDGLWLPERRLWAPGWSM